MKKILFLLISIFFISSCSISSFTNKSDFNGKRLSYAEKNIENEIINENQNDEIFFSKSEKKDIQEINNNIDEIKTSNFISDNFENLESNNLKNKNRNYKYTIPILQKTALEEFYDNTDINSYNKFFEITAFVTGIIGLVLLVASILLLSSIALFLGALIFMVLAIIFGSLTINSDMGRAGFILGIVGAVLALLIILIVLFLYGFIVLAILGGI